MELSAHGGDAASYDGLLARLTHTATRLVIVHLTQRLALVLEEASVHKRAETLPADEALWVPEGVESGDVILHDGLRAAFTTRRKQRQETLLTVLLSITVVKPFISECPAALDAAEALRMPVLIECRDHFIENGFIAVCAVRRVQAEVIRLAVRTPVLLKEVTVPQFTFTLGAHKVFGVPHLPQRRHHLSHNRFLAGGAVSLGGGRNALPA